jgi:1-acyl-sn-glycerol-3-phosphate acyltransferase
VRLLQAIARLILRLFGWTLLDIPHRPPKSVLIAYPHTSNWDLVTALLGVAAFRIRAQWVGKDTLFKGLAGHFFRAIGGISVNRRERTGFVQKLVEEFNRRETFNLLIAVEGTRRRQEGWKSGFYRIALAAKAPVLLGTVDYERKELGLLAAVDLTGDEEADMARIASFYAGRDGHPLASPIRLM